MGNHPMVMSGMSMSSHHGMKMAAMGGMSMSAPAGSTNILPAWLAVIWTLVFIVIAAVHVRHVLDTTEGRRWWHSCHVLMAVGMVVMYAPASLDHFNIPLGFWPVLFANASGAVAIWMLYAATNGRSINALWALMAIDLAAMAYMWSPSGFVGPITWLATSYFALQAVMWAADTFRELDGRTLIGAVSLSPDGSAAIAAPAAPLVCERDLRWSMGLMALGMAYMFAAMQLLS